MYNTDTKSLVKQKEKTLKKNILDIMNITIFNPLLTTYINKVRKVVLLNIYLKSYQVGKIFY